MPSEYPLGMNKKLYDDIYYQCVYNYDKYADKISNRNTKNNDIMEYLFEGFEYLYFDEEIDYKSDVMTLIVKYYTYENHDDILKEYFPKDIVGEISKYLYNTVYLLISGSAGGSCEYCRHEDDCIQKLFVEKREHVGLLLDTFTVFNDKESLRKYRNEFINSNETVIDEWIDKH